MSRDVGDFVHKKLLGKKGLFLLIVFNMLAVFICVASILFYVGTDVELIAKQYPVWQRETKNYKFQAKRPRHWTSFNQISIYARWSVILSEDWAFYGHNGIDFEQLKIVIEEAWDKMELGRGASTITQQVVKNLFLSNERSLLRKLKEIVLAYKLERVVKKNRILEIYFNIVEWGPDIYGINKASYYYFQKHPSALKIQESAFLAMLLPSPVRYSQSFRRRNLSSFARRQVKRVIRKLSQAHIITQMERDMAIDEGIFWDQGHVNVSTVAEGEGAELVVDETEEDANANADLENIEDATEKVEPEITPTDQTPNPSEAETLTP